jgi:hypothetical protein
MKEYYIVYFSYQDAFNNVFIKEELVCIDIGNNKVKNSYVLAEDFIRLKYPRSIIRKVKISD